MKKNTLNAADRSCLNPLFQQQLPKGRVQSGDYAFYLRKQSFMQYASQQSTVKENKGCETGYKSS